MRQNRGSRLSLCVPVFVVVEIVFDVGLVGEGDWGFFLRFKAGFLGALFFFGPGGFVAAALGGGSRVGGVFLLEIFELADEAEVGVAQVALVARVEEEGVGGGVFVEGFGEGEAGGIVVFLAEVVELFFGVVGALEPPEDGGDLVEELVLQGAFGAEGFAEFLAEDVVDG